MTIWRVLCAILELGNVAFDEIEDASGKVSVVSERSLPSLVLAAELLGVTHHNLLETLTQRKMLTRGEVFTVQLKVKDASNGRNAMMKALYSSVFARIVSQVNISLAGASDPLGNVNENGSIGVLDIFGFETFDRNDFEQLLINYANEALQCTFNEQVFLNELRLYQEEDIHINLSPDECPSNTACVELIYSSSRSATSVFSILHHVAHIPNATDETFCEQLNKVLGGATLDPNLKRYFVSVHPKDRKQLFAIKHFAGRVVYTVGERGATTWISKNHDIVPEAVPTLLLSSTNELLRNLIPVTTDKERKVSISDGFASSMNSLCCTLKESMCSFIRCIKPNRNMKPLLFDDSYVVEQVRSLGLVQVCEVMKVGLPLKVQFQEVATAVAPVYEEFQRRHPEESLEVFIAAFLWALDIPLDSYQLGTRWLFFRNGQLEVLEDIMKADTDSVEARESLIARIEEALAIRNTSQSIVAGLNTQFVSILDSISGNKQEIEGVNNLVATLNTKLNLVEEEIGKSKTALSSVATLFVNTQDKVDATESSLADLDKNERSLCIFNKVQLAKERLNAIDKLWGSIDSSASDLDSAFANDTWDPLRTLSATLFNEIIEIEAVLPDIMYIVNKTINGATRCQISKFQSRAADCEFNISFIKGRLEINLGDIRAGGLETERASSQVDVLISKIDEMRSIYSQTSFSLNEISSLCTEVVTMASSLRKALEEEERERKRQEEEARRLAEELQRLEEERHRQAELKRIEEEEALAQIEAERQALALEVYIASNISFRFDPIFFYIERASSCVSGDGCSGRRRKRKRERGCSSQTRERGRTVGS
jgi:myosin heavy subunit